MIETTRKARPARAPLPLSLLLLIGAASAGCSSGQAARPADPDLARRVLVGALESWKQGETPEAAARLSPPVRVLDEDWQSGARLLDFRVEPGRAIVGEQSFPVALTLKQKGRKSTRRVEYRVVTDPILAVSRED